MKTTHFPRHLAITAAIAAAALLVVVPRPACWLRITPPS